MSRNNPDPDKQAGKPAAGGGLFSSLTDFLESAGKLAGAAGQRKPSHAAGAGGGAKESGAAGGPEAGAARVGGILNNLADLAAKLKELSEKGESLSEQGEFTFPSKKGGIKGVYGFSVKTGLGEKGDQIKVEPFGNIRKDQKTGEAAVQEISEPLVDVFPDTSGTTLVAEMPGMGPDDICLEVQDDVLTIAAQKGERKYRKELLLGHLLAKDRIAVVCNNGVATIRCEKP
ncbi:MAG: Hsp20/alpha crystallin family protein [bacterium]